MSNAPQVDGQTQQQVLQICKICFREYAASQDWDGEQMAKEGRIGAFVEWCRATQMPVKDKLEFVEAGIPAEVVDLVWNEVIDTDDFTTISTFIPMWSAICMSGRPPMKTAPLTTVVQFTLQVADKPGFSKYIQINVPTRFDPKHPRTEGFIVSLIEEQFRQIIQTCRECGLNALLDEQGVVEKDFTPEEIAKIEARRNQGETMPTRPPSSEEPTKE